MPVTTAVLSCNHPVASAPPLLNQEGSLLFLPVELADPRGNFLPAGNWEETSDIMLLWGTNSLAFASRLGENILGYYLEKGGGVEWRGMRAVHKRTQGRGLPRPRPTVAAAAPPSRAIFLLRKARIYRWNLGKGG